MLAFIREYGGAPRSICFVKYWVLGCRQEHVGHDFGLTDQG